MDPNPYQSPTASQIPLTTLPLREGIMEVVAIAMWSLALLIFAILVLLSLLLIS